MNKKINQKKYLEALNFAFKLHSKQFRKGTKIPYFFHLSAVSNHVIENGGDTDEAIAGLLHDAVEDQWLKPKRWALRLIALMRPKLKPPTMPVTVHQKPCKAWAIRLPLKSRH